MTPPPVPQNDPKAAYLAQREAIDAAIAEILASGRYMLGRQVTEFEAEFAGAVGSRHGIGVGNGTDALVLALRALGIGPGKIVATVSHTAVATVAAIEMAGARPVLLDIDPATYTMDVAELARGLGEPPRGRARPRLQGAAHRGLRTKSWRALRRCTGRQRRRHRLLQLLPDEESRCAGR